jgi:hypothetical protein
MTFYEIKKTLVENIKNLTITTSNINQGNGTVITTFRNIKAFKNALNNIEKTGLLKNEIETLRFSELFVLNNDEYNMNSTLAAEITNQIARIKKLLSEVLNALESVSLTDVENTVYVKLPLVSNFDVLAEFSQKFQIVLSQAIINDDIQGEVKIVGIEEGSIIIKVFVRTVVALNLVAGIAYSSMYIYKLNIDNQRISEIVRNSKVIDNIKEQYLSELETSLAEDLKEKTALEAKYLQEKYFKTQDNEQLKRLEYSIKTLSELIEKGAEINPAINTPEETKLLFPDKSKLNEIQSQIKLLESGSE